VRLSQRLSRLSQTSGKSRAADMRDRLSRPYVNRAGKSLSLGWETLPGDYAEDVLAVIAEQVEKERRERQAETLAAAPKAGPPEGGRPKKGSKLLPIPKSSYDPSRLAARINRDHPEIAERVKAGDPQHRAAGFRQFFDGRLMTTPLHPNPQNRSTLLWLSMGSAMSPTQYRASSRTGGGADR